MLSLYHEVTDRGACTVKKELQVQQCCAVNRGLLRTVHSAAGARFEHPLRYLEEPSSMVLFRTAAIHGPSTLYECSMNPDRTPIPRMPRITHLSRFSTMGIRLSTCTMRIGRTSDSRRIRRQVGQQRYVLRWEGRFTPSLDSADCTTVTPLRPRLRQLRLSQQTLFSPIQNRW